MTKACCPALLLAAPASGQGKTTITAALARLLKRQGKRVHVFKTGPDYLDPQILEQASGQAVEMLDTWMAGDARCQQKLYEAANVADLILVEGAMGMFDGEPSSADLAARFNIPIAIVMDVKGMAQTTAAIALGLANFRNDFSVAGLIANNCGSDRHRQLIEDALPENLPLLSTLKRCEEITLPERHLGLVQAQEVSAELEKCFEAGADRLEESGVMRWLDQIAAVDFYPTALPDAPLMLQGKTIAVAKDEAFSFIYAANLQLLRDMGAEIQFFSPLHDTQLPQADALWLAGGYPELHSQRLSNNTKIKKQIRLFHQQDKPILAECGGLLYCLQTLKGLDEKEYPMLGLMPGKGTMRGKRGCQGMQVAPLPEGDVRAHAHHRSRSSETPVPISHGVRQRHPAPGEPVYRQGSLTASYLHLFFPSNAEAIADLFLGKNTQTRKQSNKREMNHVG
jgi:cobyrinic acid a,c-diamide synthase